MHSVASIPEQLPRARAPQNKAPHVDLEEVAHAGAPEFQDVFNQQASVRATTDSDLKPNAEDELAPFQSGLAINPAHLEEDSGKPHTYEERIVPVPLGLQTAAGVDQPEPPPPSKGTGSEGESVQFQLMSSGVSLDPDVANPKFQEASKTSPMTPMVPENSKTTQFNSEQRLEPANANVRAAPDDGHPIKLERNPLATTAVDAATANDIRMSNSQSNQHLDAPLQRNALPTPMTEGAIAKMQAAVVATPVLILSNPEGVGDVILKRVQAEQMKDGRITVQLDPPELGRVGIDFRVDAQGAPQITVTAETPEALRQLRQMHADLLTALERNGVFSDDIEYRQNQSDTQTPRRDGEQADTAAPTSGPHSHREKGSTETNPIEANRNTLSLQRLDIRL